MDVMATSSSDGGGVGATLRRMILSEIKDRAPQLQSLMPPFLRGRVGGDVSQQCEILGIAEHVFDAIRAAKGPASPPKVVDSTFDQFPVGRYTCVRAWEDGGGSSERQWQHMMERKWQRLMGSTVVAADRAKDSQVLLTCFPKAAVTDWQMEHAQRVLRSLEPRAGSQFQQLLHIWDAGQNWVVTQEFSAGWESVLASFAQAGAVSEQLLRDVIFQVASLVHYLHAHGLSLAGELRPDSVMVEDGRVTLLLNVSLVVSGCLLVPATDRNKAADVAAIGMLMFQLTMAPYTPANRFDICKIQKAVEDHLGFLSSLCRDTLVECLTAKLTIDELLKRKWLRNIDFVSVTSKMECSLNAQARNLLYHTLVWKLATFFMVDWLGNSWRQSARPSVADDEENLRRNRKQPKRYYSHKKSFAPGGPPRVRRGAAMVPPFGTAIIPSQLLGDDDDKVSKETARAGSKEYDLSQQHMQSWMNKEVSLEAVHVDAVTAAARSYDGFAYAVPVTAQVYEGVAYDSFEVAYSDTNLALGDGSGFMMLPHAHQPSVVFNGSADIERQIVRSLQVDSVDDEASQDSFSDTQSWNSHEMDERSNQIGSEWRDASQDAVYFSVFGPKDITRRETFRLDIWAYLKQQRASMLETALERNDAECGSRVQPLQIERGTLVTVSMEASVHFSVVGDDCKSFRWSGDVDGVSFDLMRTDDEKSTWDHDEALEQEDDLCIARVVVGTKVSMLYIRLRVSDERNMEGYQADAYAPSAVAVLESEMKQVVANVREIPIDELELLEPIGSGAFGTAMLARWTANDARVVVKTLREEAYGGSDAIEELRHEATVMQLLGKHPHVVELLGISTGGDTSSASPPSIVTEYLPNGSLEDVLGIRTNSFSSRSSSSGDKEFNLFSRTIMARDAAHGLANIHQGHFLHRDIASRNCLVDADFRVKVCDFGLSRRLQSESGFLFDDDGHGFGPLKWMAPESILPPHLFSTQSDSYMFGVLMYEIFSGSPPFPNLSTREAIALILEGQHVPIPETLPAPHRGLMNKCFHVHPLSRPTMDQIYFTLDQWIVDDTKTDSYVIVGQPDGP